MEASNSESVVDRTFREESGRAVASLIRVLGDFDLAEEAVQEAFIVALERWPRDGVPSNPGAWITQVARNRAIDRLRRDRNLREKTAILEGLEALRPPAISPAEQVAATEIADDRLRLIFTCCHPALAREARVALTLRALGGLTTAEIASAFLVGESTMAQRLVRAKKKIQMAGIPYEVPDTGQMPERLSGVLATLYLVFNEGYLGSTSSDLVRVELSAEAIRLCRLVVDQLPSEPEAKGLLALMLLGDSRRRARVDGDGRAVPLEEQDRGLWDQGQIAEGLELSEQAAAAGPVGPYTVQARIAATHARAELPDQTDWARIVRLYEWLEKVSPGPVVELNRAVAVAMSEGPEAGLALIAAIEGLDDYRPLHSARAELLRRLGRDEEATDAYARALEIPGNEVETAYLERRLSETRSRIPESG
ncbi:MAG TPA: RNA polymerase sigma factor [Solirubrobacterales bacterium]|nr:RNA polymerase sigma factor [Solirubrobacterales bacterium]